MSIELSNGYDATLRKSDQQVEVVDDGGCRLQELFFSRDDLLALLGLFDSNKEAT
jgi:hypothetical protein